MSILIVEDNLMTARMLEASLQKHGYDTVRARNGKEALDRLGQDAAGIEMVITDIMMPEMDGLELFAAIRSTPQWESLPVVVATAAADVESVTKAAQLGCEHYLLKPINTGQLLEKVRDVLVDRSPVLRDRKEMFASLSIEPSLYNDLVKLFVVQGRTLLDRLSAMPAADSLALASEALELQEGARLVGAERLASKLNLLASRKAEGAVNDSDLTVIRGELKLVLDALPEAAQTEPAAAAEPTADAEPSTPTQAGAGAAPQPESADPRGST